MEYFSTVNYELYQFSNKDSYTPKQIIPSLQFIVFLIFLNYSCSCSFKDTAFCFPLKTNVCLMRDQNLRVLSNYEFLMENGFSVLNGWFFSLNFTLFFTFARFIGKNKHQTFFLLFKGAT